MARVRVARRRRVVAVVVVVVGFMMWDLWMIVGGWHWWSCWGRVDGCGCFYVCIFGMN